MTGASETFATIETGARESVTFAAVGMVVAGTAVTGASDEFIAKSVGEGARGGMSAAMVVEIDKRSTKRTR